MKYQSQMKYDVLKNTDELTSHKLMDRMLEEASKNLVRDLISKAVIRQEWHGCTTPYDSEELLLTLTLDTTAPAMKLLQLIKKMTPDQLTAFHFFIQDPSGAESILKTLE